MKANEAPEKIWLGKYTQSLMLSDPNSNTYVEYVRKDAFVEKTWDWIEDNLLSSNQQDKSRLYFEHFKKYMEK